MKKVRSDLVGKTFDRLTVVEYSHTNKHGNAMWVCLCECGNTIVASGGHLVNGHTSSCGCRKNEISGARFRKHGMKHTRLYTIWMDMRSRCKYESMKCFKHYGGRGIKVCDEWQNSFETFYGWAIANGYSDELTIDRIDVDGNYEPSNCRWATMKEQRANQRKKVAE